MIDRFFHIRSREQEHEAIVKVHYEEEGGTALSDLMHNYVFLHAEGEYVMSASSPRRPSFPVVGRVGVDSRHKLTITENNLGLEAIEITKDEIVEIGRKLGRDIPG